MLGLIEIAPRCSGPSPGRQVKSGSSDSARLTLPDEPRTRNLLDRLRRTRPGNACASTNCRKRALRVGGRHHDPGAQLVAVLERDAASRGRPRTITLLPPARSVRISTPSARAGLRDRRADAAGAVLGEAPGAERAVDLAHVVMQQHVRGARRARPEERADDAARGLRALERVELEPLVEQVGGDCVTSFAMR